MNSSHTVSGSPAAPGHGRRSLRRALAAATILAPLGAVALYAWPPAQAQTPSSVARPTPVVAPTPVRPATPAGNSTAVAVLLERANFWRNQTQYDQALESLNRALALEPRNPDALALTGQIQADRGNRAAAENALTRLRQASPGDPRIDKIDQSLKVGPIPPEALTDARRLSKDGRQTEAVDRYNRVFRGNPPPDSLSVEYYQTLAGTPNGWEQARDGLARTVRQNPQDLRAQLAYAEVLTYRDGARQDGIQRLALLAKNPSVAENANRAWRQAVGWLPRDKESIPALQSYLAAHPNDGEIASQIEIDRNPAPDPNDPASGTRINGFDQLNRNRLNEAATAFQGAIEANPNDADATGGLGVVRLRQRRFDEARQLLSRAISLDPANRGRWQTALNGVAQAQAGAQPNPATGLMARGEYAAAESNLQRQISGGNGDIGLRGMLADSQARQNKLAAAEQTYRDILARNPRYAPALVGLAGIVSQQGKRDEALSLLQQAEAVGGGNRSALAEARAQQLREQAAQITDPVTQAGLYRSAVAADPGNPWIRLDYARALLRQGQVREARAVMAEALAGKPSTDALRAGILFANETSDPDAAAGLLAQLPASARTGDLRTLGIQIALQREIGRVIDLPRTTARARLLALAAQPDPDGARGAAIARALSSIGDSASARRAIIVARDATPNQGSAARIAYAGALLDIGDATGAQTMLAPLGYGGSLPADQKRAFIQLRAGLAIKTADDLNQAGRQAEGYDRLAPALAADPDNTEMNLALARLYSGARNPREALEINEALLRRDPTNAEARRGAVAAALQSGNRRLAEQLVKDGIDIAPDDPKSWMASADVARASGNNARALRDLARARELRLQQLGYSDNGDDGSTLTQVTLAPGAPPISSRQPNRVKLAPLGARTPPGTATPVYAGADLGQDAPDPLSVPPSFAPPSYVPSGRPTPLSASPGGPFSTAPQAPQPLRQPTPQLAPAQNLQQTPQPRSNFQQTPPPANPFSSRAALPPVDPAVEPTRGRVLDTTQADSLPAPRRVVQPSTNQTSADSLNGRALSAGPVAASQPVSAITPGYAAPGYTAPVYSTARPAGAPYVPPIYAQPQYAQPQRPALPVAAPYSQPGYVPTYVAPGAAPTYPGYLQPVDQPNPYQVVGPQVQPGARYQPQVQEYLPQYRPAPPPSSGQAILADDAQFLRGDDFDKPYRPYLPRINGDETVPFGRGTVDSGPTKFYDNPFRRSPDDALRASAGLTPGNGVNAPDPVTQEIDRNIVALRDTLAPSVQGGFAFRARSGDAGLDKLTEVTVPIEATFSPGGVAQVKLSVTPTVLTSGSIGGDDNNLQRFGTLALQLNPAQSGGTVFIPASLKDPKFRPGSQTAQGVGLNAALAFRFVTLDAGTTPVGFRIQNLVGGVELAPQLSDRVRLRLTAERRGVTDSILSYAGTVDPGTGRTWGGAVRDRGRAQVEISAGLADFYASGAAGQVTGRHVAKNTFYEFGAGGSYPIFKQGDDEIRVGLDLFYESYTKNLRFFTYGQGGYFSPQSYISALVPVIYRSKVDEDLTYEIGAAVGLQSFTEKSSPYFPLDPSLQTQVEAVPKFGGFSTRYPSRSSSGIAGNVHAKLDYRVSSNLHVGGQVAFQHSGDFDEAAGGVYARYVFNGTTSR